MHSSKGKDSDVLQLDGTGLSYEKGADKYCTNDFQTMEYLWIAIVKVLKLFLEYVSNDLFIRQRTFYTYRLSVSIPGEIYTEIYFPLAVYSVLEHTETIKGLHINQGKTEASIHHVLRDTRSATESPILWQTTIHSSALFAANL